MEDWRGENIPKWFLTGVRGALPLAETQLELIGRIVKSVCPNLESFIDLGCGDGVLGRYIHEFYPASYGVYLDYSEYMINELKTKLKYNSKVIAEDYSKDNWLKIIENDKPFDLELQGVPEGMLLH